jgi:hypothetical protein
MKSCRCRTSVTLWAIALIASVSVGSGGCWYYYCDAFSIPPSSSVRRYHDRIIRAAVVGNDDAVAAVDVDSTEEIKSLTQRIMERASSSSSSSSTGAGAGSASTWEAFQRTEANWARLKSSSPSSPSQSSTMPLFITDDGARGNPKCWEKLRNPLAVLDGSTDAAVTSLDYDVTVCGGTLGIFIATALLAKTPTLRVAVIEAAKLCGRDQEWNISRKELDELVGLGVLTEQDLVMAITTEFPGCRAGFKNREGESPFEVVHTIVPIVVSSLTIYSSFAI